MQKKEHDAALSTMTLRLGVSRVILERANASHPFAAMNYKRQ